jgi:hypothetical protein
MSPIWNESYILKETIERPIEITVFHKSLLFSDIKVSLFLTIGWEMYSEVAQSGKL